MSATAVSNLGGTTVPHDPDDRDLLARYARENSPEAFAAIVRRHLNMVYAAARRQAGDAHLAEDVAQAVFVILSRRAAQLHPNTVLVGWLYNTVRYCAANARKIEARRKHYEAKGGVMDRARAQIENCSDREADGPVQEALPLLDAALSALGARDRDAVLLKFVQGKTHKAVGDALGVTEEAARKRVERAIDKLRGFFLKRGVGVSAAAVASTLAAASSDAAPPALAGAIASASSAASGATTAAIVEGALSGMLMAKAKVAALLLFGVLAAGATGTAAFRQWSRPPLTPTARQPAGQTPGRTAVLPQGPAPVADPPQTSTVAGVVKSAAGEPVAGARVQIATHSNNVRVYDDKPSGARQSLTADDGYFTFDIGGAPCYVVVTHELGYAQVTREQLAAAEGVVTLQPWGRVEGVAKIGDQPVPRARVAIQRSPMWDYPYSTMLHHYAETTADEQGRFVFDRVASGDTWVSRLELSPAQHHALVRFTEVAAGKTAGVNLGGGGRAVVGRLALPEGSDERVNWRMGRNQDFHASVRLNGPPMFGPPRTPDWQQMTYEQRRVAGERWLATPAGRQYQNNRLHWSFWPRPDGSFRIVDLPPGMHSLTVSVHASEGGVFETVAEIERSFTVPEGPVAEPLDLGTTLLTPTKRLRMGKPAPDFTAHSAQGKDLKLSDFRGKMLLLYFFSPGQEPPAQQVAQLKLVHEKHGNEVGLLGVNFGDNPQFTKDFVAKHALPWPHATSRFGVGLLDTVRGAGVPVHYVNYPSRVFLLDAQGNVIAKSIEPAKIEDTVYRALFAK
jgi:RNA polymerase sigma factor (sigma-70 family)